ncbi:hypothetical protein DM01DRAFT_1131071 [Hesseltinella vesiculosa]|uniref:Uncharacterized protein n=1 Tax=Hesseltinella vesiculosa TaxID=101127 RepID=A0A1X2G932_9FUNG|nr:hypothetical protein DM01DRAFT_1131071 [Hesseltinella vesiculosa]
MRMTSSSRSQASLIVSLSSDRFPSVLFRLRWIAVKRFIESFKRLRGPFNRLVRCFSRLGVGFKWLFWRFKRFGSVFRRHSRAFKWFVFGLNVLIVRDNGGGIRSASFPVLLLFRDIVTGVRFQGFAYDLTVFLFPNEPEDKSTNHAKLNKVISLFPWTLIPYVSF